MMSAKVRLEVPTLDDLAFIQWLWADPETMDAVGGPIKLSDHQARDWYNRMISPGSPLDCYRLIFNQNGTPVGEISFHRLDPETMTADLNIKVAARYRGNGYAKGALRLFIEYFFDEFGGQIIQDKVAKNNQIGKSFLLDFGFIKVGFSLDTDLLELCRNRFNARYRSVSGKVG